MKIGIIYGALIALALLVVNLLIYLLPWFGFPGLLIHLAATVYIFVLGLKRIKKEVYNGQINYSQSLFNGIYICLFAGILCSMVNALNAKYINPFDVEGYLVKMEQNLIKEKKGDKEIKETIAKEREYLKTSTDVGKITSATLFIYAFLCMVINVVASAFIRNKEVFSSPENFKKNN